MNPIEIIGIPAFSDNYIWMLVQPQNKTCVVVDPGEAKPVINALNSRGLSLEAILVTHHHGDHSGGVGELLNLKKVAVYGGMNDRIPHCSHPVQEGDSFDIASLGLGFKVLSIPGHTLGHVAFVSKNILFCGDTLFTAGCGKIFEGTAAQMFDSLAKLKALPKETLVYCGHEYTLNNLRFAITVEPDNEKVARRLKETEKLRLPDHPQTPQPTVPSTMQVELETNPFLRTHVKTLQQKVEQYAGRALADEIEVFGSLREMKNQFRG